MKTKIFIGLLLLLFGGTLLVAGGVLAAKKARHRPPLVLPVDGAKPPQAYVGPSPVVYEASIQPDCEDINPDPWFGVIQHDQFGSTYYDKQRNGSMGRMIAVGPAGHRHMMFHETRGPYGAQYPRWITYNCKDPLGVWLGPTYADGGEGLNAGYGSIDVLHDGRAVLIYHRTAGDPCWHTTLAVQDSVCGGFFPNKYDLPDWLQHDAPGMWPKMGIVYDAEVDTDYIHVVMTEGRTTGGNQRLGYERCHLIAGDTLFCETPNSQAGVVSPIIVPPNTPGCGEFCPIAYFGEVTGLPDEYPNTISVVVATSPVSQKAAIVFINKRGSGYSQVNNDVFYFESTNNGMEWFPQWGGTWPPTLANGMLHNVSNYPTEATERAYTDVAACYDYNDSLHIVWNAHWFDSAAGLVSYDANLYHWDKEHGISMIADGYWDDAIPGSWNRNVCKMSISAQDPIYHPGGDPDSVYLFCIWTQFDPGDMSWCEYTNGDIYAAVSSDGGATWSARVNLTNTKTPDCDSGECLSEHYSSLAENPYDGDLHIQYVCDRDPGRANGDEGTWTDNPMMYLHVVKQFPPPCGISYSILDPPSFTTPPIKVPPFGQKIAKLRLSGIYNSGGDYEVTSNHPKVICTGNCSGHLEPGEEKIVELTIYCSGEDFINAFIIIRGCIGTPYETTIEIPLYAVCSNDYYECDRDSATFIEKDNGTLKLWTCVNSEEFVWDKRIESEDNQQVIFSGGVIVATTWQGDTVVGRQDYRDLFTGARDTINVVEGFDYFEPECNIQKIHVKDTYIWTPHLLPPNDFKWWWIDIHKQIIFFHDHPGYPPCPNWKKEQVIKYVWIDWSSPPVWWPDPGVYEGHEDIYLGVFADIDAPFDEGCNGCNVAGYDYEREMIWQHGYNAGQHPEYEDHYVGLALTDSSGAVVAPLGCQNVLAKDYLYPQGGWGWKDGELYQLSATSGVNIHHPDSVADRAVVLTAEMIPAGTDTTFESEFILIEASIPSGLADLQAHMDTTREVLIPELRDLGLFSKEFPICGDINSDEAVNVSDVIYLINYLFIPGGPPPSWPMNRADVNYDGSANIEDVVYLISYLFVTGSPSPECSGFGKK